MEKEHQLERVSQCKHSKNVDCNCETIYECQTCRKLNEKIKELEKELKILEDKEPKVGFGKYSKNTYSYMAENDFQHYNYLLKIGSFLDKKSLKTIKENVLKIKNIKKSIRHTNTEIGYCTFNLD